MAAGNTEDTRIHVLGDMVMLTGTFTDGGTNIYFGDTLDTVFAAGGHYTHLTDIATEINNGGGYAAGTTTALTVDGTDPRLFFNVGETAYTSAGERIGDITAIGSGTSITFGGGTLVTLADDDNLFKLGATTPAITLTNDNLDVAIDETNKYVVINTGNFGNTSSAAAQDGRWWILGKR